MPIIIGGSSSIGSGGTGSEPLVKTLATDAWNRNKVYADKSAFHGMYTFNIPSSKWKESINTVEQSSFAGATSLDGKLHLTSNSVLDDKVKLDSFRNPRYEPNRGFLYSSSIFLPSPTALGERNFGVFTEDSGVFFRVKSDGLYAVRRTTTSGTPSEVEELIDVPENIDLSKGNTYDIQFQWRGVGNYYFFINQILVHEMELLGKLTDLSISNPAAPIAFECINKGVDVVLECGCVDISIEGGEVDGKTYGSVSINNTTGSLGITGLNIPIIALRSVSTIGGLINTRDTRFLKTTGYADQRCVFRLWKTRDQTAITLNSQVWDDFGDGHLERIIYDLNLDGTALVGTAMTFDTSKAELVEGARIDQDQTSTLTSLFEGATELYITPGDIFVVTLHRETGLAVNVGASCEFAEAI